MHQTSGYINCSGNADQHIHYLPIGKLFISQCIAFDNRYKFIANEFFHTIGTSISAQCKNRTAAGLFFLFLLLSSNISIYAQNHKFFDKSPKKYTVKRYITSNINDKIDKALLIEIRFSKNLKNNNMTLCFGKCSNKLIKSKKNNYSLNLYFANDTLFVLSNAYKEPMLIFDNGLYGDTVFLKNVFYPLTNHFINLDEIKFYSDIDDEVYIFNLERIPEVQVIEKDKLYKTTSIDYYFFEKIAVSKTYGFIWIRYKYLDEEIEIWYK